MPPLCHFRGCAFSSATAGSFLRRCACGRVFALAPPRIRAERSKRGSELRQVDHRARTLQIFAGCRDVEIEQVLPWTSGDRPRLELRQIDVAQREHTQRLEQRARRALEREDEARLVGRAERYALTGDRQEPRDVVVVILNAAPQRLEAEERARSLGRNRRRVALLLVTHHLRAARRVVRRDGLDVLEAAQESRTLRKRLGMRQYP